MQHLICSNVVQNETHGLCRVELLRNGYQVCRWHQGEAAVPTNHGEGRNAQAEGEAGNALAERVHLANDVVAGGKRGSWHSGVKPATHQDVGVRDTGSKDLHSNLTRGGRRQVLSRQFENLGATRSGDHRADVFLGGHQSERLARARNEQSPGYPMRGPFRRAIFREAETKSESLLSAPHRSMAK